MASLIQTLAETAREQRTGDDKFLKPYLFFFELRIPASASVNTFGITTFFFPLVLNPESITKGVPFSVDVAQTQGSGLFVEESGIVQRSLAIQGTTGWKPKPFQGDTLQLWALKDRKSFTRSLPLTVDALSGMRHMQYLEDAVFNTYGDLKRDPATSEDTQLFFHDPKEEEHWRVVPRSFTLTKSKSSPNIGYYSIELLIVDKAEAVKHTFSEDATLLQELKGALQTVQRFIDLATGALQDLTALTASIKGLVQNVAVIIDNVSNVITAAKNFVSGVTALILTPLTIVKSTTDLIENGLSFYTNLLDSGKQIAAMPDAILQSFRQLGDALDLLGTHPESFVAPGLSNVSNFVDSSQVSTNAPGSTPTTFQQVNNLGSAPMPGDASRAKAQTNAGAAVKNFTGAQLYTVSEGDTLMNLAARFLGDARDWTYIAAANGLKPPFIIAQATAPLGISTENSLSGAIGVGTKILIPNYSQPPSSQPQLPVLGVPPNAPADVHLLGSDLKLVPVLGQPNLVDFAINTDNGGLDFQTVLGVPNLVQGLTTRLTTDRGTDVLYQNVGVQRLVATNVASIDLETLRFRVQETLAQDTRLAAVQNVSFTVLQDVVSIDATVQVRGYSQPSNIQVTA